MWAGNDFAQTSSITPIALNETHPPGPIRPSVIKCLLIFPNVSQPSNNCPPFCDCNRPRLVSSVCLSTTLHLLPELCVLFVMCYSPLRSHCVVQFGLCLCGPRLSSHHVFLSLQLGVETSQMLPHQTKHTGVKPFLPLTNLPSIHW